MKYLFHQGRPGRPVHADALAGALEIRRAQADELLERLAAMGLAESTGTGARLSESGRGEALRIIRSHRLLEQYLADRTGIDPAEWHEVAERASTNSRARRSRRSPCGSASRATTRTAIRSPRPPGRCPEHRRLLLASLGIGRRGTIVHLEDEPRDTYERLRALGLRARQDRGGARPERARPSRSSSTATCIVLPRALEGAISVARAPRTRPRRVARTLADLGPGESGHVCCDSRAPATERSAGACSTSAWCRAPRSRPSCGAPPATRSPTASAAR